MRMRMGEHSVACPCPTPTRVGHHPGVVMPGAAVLQGTSEESGTTAPVNHTALAVKWRNAAVCPAMKPGYGLRSRPTGQQSRTM